MSGSKMNKWNVIKDFTILFNRVYVCFSYASWLFIVCMIIRQVRDYMDSKKTTPPEIIS